MNAPAIIIKNATLTFNQTTIFSDINVNFPAGKWIAILGESGVGKSSFLRMIAGLLPNQYAGSINTDNHIPIHQQVAYMAQTDLLLPWMTVLDNTLLGVKLRGKKSVRDNALRSKAETLLAQVGLSQVIHYYPHQLSGGMRQRVSLVRTLMEDKPIILMDEPFSALDALTRYQLQAYAAQLLQNKTIVFITHDIMEALRLSNSIYVMQHQPAQIKFIAHLTSNTPRDLNHPEVNLWQELLFQTLFKKGMSE